MGLDRNEGHPLLCGASNEVTSTRNGLWNGCRTPLMATLVQSHLAPLSKPQRFGVVPISTPRLALTMWNGTSKHHYEQLRLRRTGRQLSKIQFLCIRIDAKQLIVVNMLSCSGVPSGGTFASKHGCNEIVLRRVQGENNFVVTPFHQNRAPRRVLGWSNSVGLRNACATPPKAPLARSHLAAFIRTSFVLFPGSGFDHLKWYFKNSLWTV